MGSITNVAGIEIGHVTDLEGGTGCTVILARDGARAAVDLRGGAPATRETPALEPGSIVEELHGIVLSGGSAFGLAAADGVVRYLEEQGLGFPAPTGPVPVVPGAAIYDLPRARKRPTARWGYEAARRASTEPPAVGRVGAGTGATVAKYRGEGLPGGVGTASATVGSYAVGALVVVNSLGAIRDPETGEWVAAPRDSSGRVVRPEECLDPDRPPAPGRHSTTLSVVATDAPLDRAGLRRVAVMAQTGLARVIWPVHTLHDGDCLFALSTVPGVPVDPTAPGVLGAQVLGEAVTDAIRVSGGG